MCALRPKEELLKYIIIFLCAQSGDIIFCITANKMNLLYHDKTGHVLSIHLFNVWMFLLNQSTHQVVSALCSNRHVMV
jgi:hypothetical protein